MVEDFSPHSRSSLLSSTNLIPLHQTQQFLVIGAGMAGMSVASQLVGNRRSVAILEKEEVAPPRATRRSASLKDPVHLPNRHVASLARASHVMFESFPHALHDKASLHLFGEGYLAELTRTLARCQALGADVALLETEAIEGRHPFLRSSEAHCLGGIYAPPGVAHSIDVDCLYGHFRSHFLEHGGRICYGQELISATWSGGAWTVHTQDRTIRAEVIVNCAGPLADAVASRCHVKPLGLVPLKRTMIETGLVPHPLMPDPHGLFVSWHSKEPLHADFRGHGRVLVSTADDQASQPGNTKPDDDEAGRAVERFLRRTHLSVVAGRGCHWAGHGTFMGDQTPVIGWAIDAHGFFWSAGHGGFGIECAPAAGALAADLLLGDKHFAALAAEHAIDPKQFAPERLQVLVHLR